MNIEEIILAKKLAGGSSPSVDIEQLNVTENGTYSETGKAYSPVIVEVPAPTLITKTITENGTYNASEDNADGYSQVTVDVEGFKKKSIANTPTDIASFNDGTANPMPSLEISIEPVQSGSGDPSPSNVRPISGWSGARIADDAKYGGFINWNQLAQKNTASWTSNNTTVTLNDDEFTITSNNNTQTVLKSLEMRAVNNHVCFCSAYLKTGDPDYAAIIGVRYRSGLMSGDNRTSNTDYTLCSSIGKADDDSYLSLRIQNAAPIGTSVYAKKVMFIDLTQMFGTTIADYIYSLEQATAGAGVAYFRNLFPHDYYPYNAGEITTVSAVNGDVDKYSITSIPFHDSSDNPITVYGGTLNVTSGELTVTHANIASYNGETINEPWISSMDVYSAGATPTTGAQVVYPLATPQTYQHTPAQVSTLLGQNNIFADCGQILEGEYFVTL